MSRELKNTLADTMSRLVTLDPDIKLVKEPEGYQFGKQIGLNDDVAETESEANQFSTSGSCLKIWETCGPHPRQRHIAVGN